MAQRRAARAVSTGETGAVAQRGARRGRCRGEAVRSSRSTSRRPEAPPGHAPAVGDRVVVGGLGLEGVVTSIHDGTADLDVRGKRMRASLRDLRVVGAAAPAAGDASTSTCSCSRARRGTIGSERHRLQRRRGDRARRAVSRRIAARRSARRPGDSRVRHRAAQARARGLPPAASARRPVRDRAARTGRRRRHGRGVEGVVGN